MNHWGSFRATGYSDILYTFPFLCNQWWFCTWKKTHHEARRRTFLYWLLQGQANGMFSFITYTTAVDRSWWCLRRMAYSHSIFAGLIWDLSFYRIGFTVGMQYGWTYLEAVVVVNADDVTSRFRTIVRRAWLNCRRWEDGYNFDWLKKISWLKLAPWQLLRQSSPRGFFINICYQPSYRTKVFGPSSLFMRTYGHEGECMCVDILSLRLCQTTRHYWIL